MNTLKEKRLKILYNHYKDTFLHIRQYSKQREWLLVFALIVIFLQFLQISSPGQSLEAFNIFTKSQFYLDFSFSQSFLNNILWFILFSISLRYFQSNILINRQYKYLHRLEDKICKEAEDDDFIRREGQEYLKKYPLFFSWTHIVYTIFFPILLTSVVIIKIILELILGNGCSLSLLMSLLFSIGIILTTVFYLVNIHQNNK